MKFCKDCKYYLDNEYPMYSYCLYNAPEDEFNLVSGIKLAPKNAHHASTFRYNKDKYYSDEVACGVEGKYWEQK